MELTFYGEEVIPENKFEAFRKYKYSGCDASILYKHFYSPFADFLVNKVIPPFVAFYKKPEYCLLMRLPLLDSGFCSPTM